MGYLSALKTALKNILLTVLMLLQCNALAQSWPRNENPKQLPYQAMEISQFIKLEAAYIKALKEADFTALEPFYLVDSLPLAEGIKGKKENQQILINLLKTKRVYGWGMLAVNPLAVDSLFLQVPHRFHDSFTADISAHWWQSGRFKLAMLNNVHRHTGRELDKPVNSDWSTSANNPMLAATRAFVSSFKQPLVLQLHGYSKDKRRTKAAQNADVILSHGANLPTAYLSKLIKAGACIDEQTKMKTLVFPHDVTELGATKNIIGKELRFLGYYQHFVHIELSKTLRQQMQADSALSLQILDCIIDPLVDVGGLTQ